MAEMQADSEASQVADGGSAPETPTALQQLSPFAASQQAFTGSHP